MTSDEDKTAAACGFALIHFRYFLTSPWSRIKRQPLPDPSGDGPASAVQTT